MANLIMVDFASKDKRSVAAMLQGNGDGREKNFVKFKSEEILRDPVLTEEQIADSYQRQSHAEYFRGKGKVTNFSLFWLGSRSLAR